MTDDLLLAAPPRRRRSVGLWPGWLQSLTDDEPIDVSVCIANWNCRDLLRGCLESLHDRPQGVRLETIVVDNASRDGADDMVARDFPDVVLIRNSENVGFSRASNQAAAQARGRHLLFLNNDTVVPAGALRRLVAYADAHPKVGMIGPRLRDGRGRPQISYRRKPTVAALLHRTVLLRWTGLFRRASRRYRRADFNPLERRPVEVLAGAAVFLPRDVFLAAGRWDEGFAFGGEDIDLCVRVGSYRSIVYFPDVEITHFGRVSSRENIAFADAHLPCGHVRLLRKLGTGWAAILGYKLLVTCDAPLACVAKWGQFLVRRIFSGRRKAAREPIGGAWNVVFPDSRLG